MYRENQLEEAKRDHDLALQRLLRLQADHFPRRLNGFNDQEVAQRSLDFVNRAAQLLTVIRCAAQLVLEQTSEEKKL